MIAIVNVSKRLRSKGRHIYELRINEKVIATFTHRREEDLEKCLLKAAEAAKWAELNRISEACQQHCHIYNPTDAVSGILHTRAAHMLALAGGGQLIC